MYRRHLLRYTRMLAPASLLVLVVAGLAFTARPGSAQMPAGQMAAAAPKEEEEVPHPFFTHEGLPDAVGNFSLRGTALETRANGRTKGDFAFHFETGLTKSIGVHIRNDQYRETPRTEIMFQFAAAVSEDGRSGIAPLIEFEIPTRKEGERVASLIGFTSKLANSRIAFNQVVHYDPRESGVDASASLVAGVTKRIYPVVEVLGMGASGSPTIVNMLTGVKVRVREGFLLGFAFQLPLTDARDFSSQLALQPDIEWGKAMR